MTRTTLFGLGIAMLISLAAVVLAHGGGHNVHQIENAGWVCHAAGPQGWLHCSQESILSQMRDGAAAITVKVYHHESHEFLKTELLLRGDLYNGQPCPTEGADEWFQVGPYYACHH